MSPRNLIALVTLLMSSALYSRTASAATLLASDLIEGDLVIDEIMKDPNAVSDVYGEWFEIYNASGSDVDLSGLHVYDGGTDTFTVASSVVVSAGGYAVLSLNKTSGTNGGITVVDYKYASSTFRLNNTIDQIYLANDTVVVDSVSYDATTFPSVAGVSLSLDSTALDSTSNDDGSNWCEATSTYGLGDSGTPGSANDGCGSGGLGDLVAGDLVVTEIMKDPTKVADYNGEYFEVYNNSGISIDLQGLVVSDLGTDSFTVSSSVPMSAGDIAVFVVAGSAVNGGITSYDYDYPSASYHLDNTADEVILGYGGVTFDSVYYTTSFPNTAGFALSLDPSYWDATSNDSATAWCKASSTYGSGDYGTPGSVNDSCGADGDGDGYTVVDGDCNDSDASIHPGATDGYDGVDTDCDGYVDEDALGADDIVVTEVMQDPYKVIDTYGEWFELYNTSARDIDLKGWEIKGSDGDKFTVSGSFVMSPGDTAVFCVKSDTTINGGVTVDYAYSRGTFKLNNDADDILLTVDGMTVSSYGYDATWPLTPGKALQIDPDYSIGGYEDNQSAWCLPTAKFGKGDYGSPGSVNEDCDIIETGLFISGDLIITEIMKDPSKVPDYNGEYFEVYNDSGSPVDMNGLVVKDSHTDTFTISGPVLIGDGEYGLFVLEADSTKNGGITDYDYDYPATLRLSNGADDIYVYDGTTLIDGVAYDNGVTFYDGEGASISLDPAAYDVTSNNTGSNWCAATSTYGSGDKGTPGSANDDCP